MKKLFIIVLPYCFLLCSKAPPGGLLNTDPSLPIDRLRSNTGLLAFSEKPGLSPLFSSETWDGDTNLINCGLISGLASSFPYRSCCLCWFFWRSIFFKLTGPSFLELSSTGSSPTDCTGMDLLWITCLYRCCPGLNGGTRYGIAEGSSVGSRGWMKFWGG